MEAKKKWRLTIRTSVLTKTPLVEILKALNDVSPTGENDKNYITLKFLKYASEAAVLELKTILRKHEMPLHKIENAVTEVCLKDAFLSGIQIYGDSENYKYLISNVTLLDTRLQFYAHRQFRDAVLQLLDEKQKYLLSLTETNEFKTAITCIQSYLLEYTTQFTDITKLSLHDLFDGKVVYPTCKEWKDIIRPRRSLEKTLMKSYNNKVSDIVKHTSSIRDNLRLLLDWTTLANKYSVGENYFVRDNFSRVITVEHPIIVLSKHLQKLETTINGRPKNNQINEVRLFASEKIYIDAHLANPAWHGINILLVSKEIECLTEVAWNVSGRNAEVFHNIAPNGTTGSPNGWPGKPGCPGESGGNVNFLSKSYFGMHKLTIIANGGDGADGQDGGDGAEGTNGKNGEPYQIDKFNEDFSTSGLWSKNGSIMRNIMFKIQSERTGLLQINGQGFTDDGKRTATGISEMRWLHIKGMIKGREFEFGFYERELKIFSIGSSYMLMKGEKGEEGTKGGKGGTGGKGGYGGNGGKIKMLLNTNEKYCGDRVTEKAVDGSNGRTGMSGTAGKNGANGKNGTDVAFTDEFPGLPQRKTFSGDIFKITNSEKGVWCEFRKSYVAIEKIGQGNLKKLQKSSMNVVDGITQEEPMLPTKVTDIDLDTAFAAYGNLRASVLSLQTYKRKQQNLMVELKQRKLNRTLSKHVVLENLSYGRQSMSSKLSSIVEIHSKNTNTKIMPIDFVNAFRQAYDKTRNKSSLLVFQSSTNPSVKACVILEHHSESLSETPSDTVEDKLEGICILSITDSENVTMERVVDKLENFSRPRTTDLISTVPPILLHDLKNQNWRYVAADSIRIRPHQVCLKSVYICVLQNIDGKLQAVTEEVENIWFNFETMVKYPSSNTIVEEFMSAFEIIIDYEQLFVSISKQTITPTLQTAKKQWPNSWLHIFMIHLSLHDSLCQRLLTTLLETGTVIFNLNKSPYWLLDLILSSPVDNWYASILASLLAQNSNDGAKGFLEKVPKTYMWKICKYINNELSTSSFKSIKLALLVDKIIENGNIDDDIPFPENHHDSTIDGWHSELEKYRQARLIKASIHKVVWTEHSLRKVLMSLEKASLSISQEEFLCLFNSKISAREVCTAPQILLAILRLHESGDMVLNISTLMKANNLHSYMKTVQRHLDLKPPRATQEILQLITKHGCSDPVSLPSGFCNLPQLMPKTGLHDIKSWYRRSIENFPLKKENFDKFANDALLKVNQAIQILYGNKLRDTQKVAIMTSFFKHMSQDHIGSTNNKNILIEMKTGEGKSYVVAAHATLKGIFGIRSDIVTASHVLAERDAIEFSKLFEVFNLSCGHLGIEDEEQRKQEYNKTIVYGDASQFQRDYLLDHFYRSNIRADRPFQGLIVDEVDSMFIDKGHSVLYISHTPACMDSLEIIFLKIWVFTIEMLEAGDYDPDELHTKVLELIVPVLGMNQLECFENPDTLRTQMVDADIIDLYGVVNSSNIKRTFKLDLSDTEKSLLLLLLRETLSHYNAERIQLPKKIGILVRLHLTSWIKMALIATQMREHVEYMLLKDIFSEDGKHEKVVIIDLDTGVAMGSTHWDNGLHQFLELKHGCRLSSMSLKSVFVSNISFFQKYDFIFGLSGTLGSKLDKNFLCSTYNSDQIILPTAFPNRFMEEEDILCETKDAWLKAIVIEVQEVLQSGRSILIICETVRKANQVYDLVSKEVKEIEITVYTRDTDKCKYIHGNCRLELRKVLVSTNLAGRGTDIKISDTLKRAGGLHVILTYQPNSPRVKLQAFGRAGRSGDLGSGRQICYLSDTEATKLSSEEYRQAQEMLNASLVIQTKDHYDNVIIHEEKMFAEFKVKFDTVNACFTKAFAIGNIEDSAFSVDTVQLQEVGDFVRWSMLDDWALWLDQYSSVLNESKGESSDLNSSREEIQLLCEDFTTIFNKYIEIADRVFKRVWLQTSIFSNDQFLSEQLMEKPGTSLSNQIISDSTMRIKFATFLMDHKGYQNAEKLLRIIELDENNDKIVSTTALFYRIFCTKMLKSELKEAIQKDIPKLLAEMSDIAEHEADNAATIQHLNRHSKLFSTQTSGFLAQKMATSNILSHFRAHFLQTFGNWDIGAADFQELFAGDMEFARYQFLELQRESRLGGAYVTVSCPDAFRGDTFVVGDNRIRQFDVIQQLEEMRLQKLPNSLHEFTSILSDKWKLPSSGDLIESLNISLIDQCMFLFVVEGATNSLNFCEFLDGSTWITERADISKSACLITDKTRLSGFDGKYFCATAISIQDRMDVCSLLDQGLAWLENVYLVASDTLLASQATRCSNLTSNLLNHVVGETLANHVFNDLISRKIIDETGVLLNTNFEHEILQVKEAEYDIVEDCHTTDVGVGYDIFSHLGDDTKHLLIDTIKWSCIYQFEILRMFRCTTSGNNVVYANLQMLSDYQSAFADFVRGCFYKWGTRVLPEWLQIHKETVNALKSQVVDITRKVGIEFLPIQISKAELQVVFPRFPDKSLEALDALLLRYKIINDNGTVDLNVLNTLTAEATKALPDYIVYKIKNYTEFKNQKQRSNFDADLDQLLVTLSGEISTHDISEYELQHCTLDSLQVVDKDFENEMQLHRLAKLGLDRIFYRKDKYTAKMFIQVSVIAALGTLQVIASYYVSMSIVGVSVSKSLAQSGVNDIVFAMQSLISGKVNMQNYVISKICGIASGAASDIKWKEVFKGTEAIIEFGVPAATESLPQIAFTVVNTVAHGELIKNISGLVDNLLDAFMDFCLTSLRERLESHENLNKLILDCLHCFGKEEAILIIKTVASTASSILTSDQWYIVMYETFKSDIDEQINAACEKFTTSNENLGTIVTQFVSLGHGALKMKNRVEAIDSFLEKVQEQLEEKVKDKVMLSDQHHDNNVHHSMIATAHQEILALVTNALADILKEKLNKDLCQTGIKKILKRVEESSAENNRSLERKRIRRNEQKQTRRRVKKCNKKTIMSRKHLYQTLRKAAESKS